MRDHTRCGIVILTALSVLIGVGGQAVALVTFFGEDLNGSNARLSSTPNADAARDDFFSFLVNPGTEDFETLTTGATPTAFTFGTTTGTVTNVTSIVTINSIPTGVLGGLYPISGDKILRQDAPSSSSFDIEFSTSVVAFGLFGIDVGDSLGQLNITLHYEAGGTENLVVPHNIGDSSNAAVFYFGVISSDKPFNKVTMLSANASSEAFGYDNMTVAAKVDSDRDGVADDEDDCPDSDLSTTVVIEGCNSGVSNTLFIDNAEFGNGCTIADLVMKIAASASNHGQFVSGVAHLTNDLKKAGIISGSEKGAIQDCAAQSSLP